MKVIIKKVTKEKVSAYCLLQNQQSAIWQSWGNDITVYTLCFLSKIFYKICTIIDLTRGVVTNQPPKEPFKLLAPTNISGWFKWSTSPRASFKGFPCSNIMRSASSSFCAIIRSYLYEYIYSEGISKKNSKMHAKNHKNSTLHNYHFLRALLLSFAVSLLQATRRKELEGLERTNRTARNKDLQ